MASASPYTEDHIRHFRLLSVLLDLGTRTLRRKFEERLTDEGYTDLQDFLSKNSPNIDNDNSFFKAQRRLLYPQGQDASIETFDISLLTSLILHYLSAYSQHGNKSVKHLSYLRNDLHHKIMAGVEQPDFSSRWSELRKNLLILDRDPDLSNEIDKFETQSFSDAEIKTFLQNFNQQLTCVGEQVGEVNRKIGDVHVHVGEVSGQVCGVGKQISKVSGQVHELCEQVSGQVLSLGQQFSDLGAKIDKIAEILPTWTLKTDHFEAPEIVLKDIKHTKKKVKEYVKLVNIAKDAAMMNEMVLAAKGGEFDTVERILKERKHIINGIPAERAWSVLHQAVSHNNVPAVKMLLAFDNCDVNVRAKRDRGGLTKPGDMPIELSKEIKLSKEIEDLLKKKDSTFQSDVPTFVEEELGEIYIKEGIPLFLMSPAFLPEKLSKIMLQNCNDFWGLTQSFYSLIKENLTEVKSCLSESLYAFSADLYPRITNIKEFDDFVKEIINIYTSNHVYEAVNLSLRRSSEKLNPTGDDLLLCLYSFILETVLLNFNFPAYDGISYRGAQLTADQMSMYKVGTTFVWMSFTSSSESKSSSFPGSVKFIFDNSCNSKWRPRDISSCSKFRDEAERLYPAGAKFRVTSVDESSDPKEINLKLMQ